MKQLLFISCCLLAISFAARHPRQLKVLISAPTIAPPHSRLNEAFALELARRNHSVTLLVVDVNPEMNYTGPINAANVEVIKVKRKTHDNPMMESLGTLDVLEGVHDMIRNGELIRWSRLMSTVCEELTTNQTLLKRLTEAEFDVGMSEEFDPCAFAVFHHVGIRTKIITNAIPFHLSVARMYGVPMPASYVPNIFAASYDAPYMSFLNRVRTLISNYLTVHSLDSVYEEQHTIVERNLGSPFPSIQSIMRNTSLVFNHQFDLLDMPHPSSAKVVNVGGIGFRPAKMNLSSDLQKIFSTKRKGGVVYVSFGALLDLDKYAVAHSAILDTFRQFDDYEFIWTGMSSANETIADKLRNISNVHLMAWTDQVGVLSQKRLKLFITYCGVNSYMEAAWAGKPMVGLPLVADALYNCASMRHLGLGLCVDIQDIGRNDALRNAIDIVLNTPTYASRALEVSAKLRAQPFNSTEKFVRNVEFAAEFGDLNELNLPYYNEVGLLEYHSVDVALAGVGTVLLLAIGAVLLPVHTFLTVVCFPSSKELKKLLSR